MRTREEGKMTHGENMKPSSKTLFGSLLSVIAFMALRGYIYPNAGKLGY